MYGIKILVTGDYALFSRPELKVERVSYDVPTPSAMEGLIKSVYWHPGIRYVIDKIVVINPIKFTNIKRNEIKVKLSESKVKKQMKGGNEDLCIYSSENRTQRASLILKDVCYGIEAHFELTDKCDKDMTEEKCFAILSRRLRKGQNFSKAFLGCREFPANIEMVDSFPESKITEDDIDLGYMLYRLDYFKDKGTNYSDVANPRFYRPHMKKGVIDVAEYVKEVI